MSDSLEARSVSSDQETVQQVKLGDGAADNDLLSKSLKQLAERVGSHAEDKSKLASLLKSVAGYIWWPAACVVSPLVWAIKVFTGHEEKIIRAKADARKAEAEAKRIEAEADKLKAQTTVEPALLLLKGNADAAKTLAEADKTKADAERTRAEIAMLLAQAAASHGKADAMQANVGQGDEIAKLLKMLGVQWAGTVSESGVLRIVVVKDNLPSLPEPDEEDEPPKELPEVRP